MKKFFILLLKTVLFLTLILYAFIAYPQNRTADSLKNAIDSLKKVLQTQKEDTNKVNTLSLIESSFFQMGDNETALSFARQALSLSEKINYIKGKGRAYIDMGFFYMMKKDLPNALSNCNNSLKIMNEINDQAGISACYDVLQMIYEAQNNFPEAIRYTHLKLEIDKKTGDKRGIGMMFSRMAFLYAAMHNDSDALKNYKASYEIHKEIGDGDLTAVSAINLASFYFKSERYPEALLYDSVAWRIFKENQNSQWPGGLAMSHLDFGNIYAKLGESDNRKGDFPGAKSKFSEASKNYFEALKLAAANNDTFRIAGCYLNLGKLKIIVKGLTEAKVYLETSLQLYKYQGSILNEELIDNYKALSTLDSLNGNYKSAYENYKFYVLYRDSLANEDNSRKLLQAQMQYDFDKKEAVTKVEQDKKDAEAKRIKAQQYFAIAALAVIVLAVIIISIIQFRNNKQKQKANIKLLHQKEKVESTLSELKSTQAQLIQSEKMASLGELTAGIAHEIQNPLNFVNNFSEVNTELLDEAEQEIINGNISEVKTILNDIKDNEQKIIHHGKRADAIVKGMLQHSRVSTGQKEATDINALADEYLRLSYHGMRAKDKTFNATLQTDFDTTIGKINVVPQDIGRVLLNLYNNAFYATSAKALATEDSNYQPTVSISTKRINSPSGVGGIEICVSDNGSGIPQKIVDKIFQPFFTTKPTGQGTGLGLSLSYDIIIAHGGEIKVESKEGEGAEFIIQLPI